MFELETCYEITGFGGGEDGGLKFLRYINHLSIVVASYSRRLESTP